MATKQQEQMANWVLDQVGSVNPYSRQGTNSKSEYYIYESGFVAAYLASLMIDDPWELKRFERHIKAKKGLDKGRR